MIFKDVRTKRKKNGQLEGGGGVLQPEQPISGAPGRVVDGEGLEKKSQILGVCFQRRGGILLRKVHQKRKMGE